MLRQLCVCLTAGIATIPMTSYLSASAATLQQGSSNTHITKISVVLAADQSALVKKNREILLTNRALARKIATKLGISSSGDVPTSGTPLEQNEVLILQNQETFKAIAAKLGASVPSLPGVDGADQAEKNHKLLLQNRSIVGAILKKLGITPAAPPELKGTFVDKNNVLLVANGKALAKIAAKVGA